MTEKHYRYLLARKVAKRDRAKTKAAKCDKELLDFITAHTKEPRSIAECPRTVDELRCLRRSTLIRYLSMFLKDDVEELLAAPHDWLAAQLQQELKNKDDRDAETEES